MTDDVKGQEEGRGNHAPTRVEVEIDPSRLDLDDFLTVADWRAGKPINPIDLVVFLDHVIAGGIRGRHYPQEALPQLFEAVETAMMRVANPAVQGKV